MKTMNRFPLILILAGLGLTAPAYAAFVTAEIPALPALPVMLSGAAAAPMAPSLMSMPLTPLAPALSLPSPSLPVNFPRSLPGVWNHLPVELPAEAAVPVPRPAHDEYHLDWSFLDGGHHVAHVAIPVSPAPKPLPPAGAKAQLVYAAEIVTHEFAAAADSLYDDAHAFLVTVK